MIKTYRIDPSGRAYAGSQLQIQIYVNRYQEYLNLHILESISSLSALNSYLRWVSPLEKDKFIEYQDYALLRAVGFDNLANDLNQYWPKGGPCWDALAVVEGAAIPNRGVLLVEAKSHPPEIYGNGCQASPSSRKKIEAALNRTKEWLGVRKDLDWTGTLYKSANRLAHLYFFRKVANISAWLVNIYFLSDHHSPTSYEEWKDELNRVKAELGITGINIPFFADVFLEARNRSELFIED